MALIDYAELLASVRELIDGTGRQVTFNKLGTTVADPAKPWKPSGAVTTATAFATFVPVGTIESMGHDIKDDELHRRADQECVVAPHATVDLTTYNTITDGGVTWRIEWISVLKPGDTVLLLVMGVCR